MELTVSGRYTRSWALVKASAAVLNQNRSLLLFPLISSVVMAFVVLCFALPLLGIEGLGRITHMQAGPGTYGIGFLFYVVQYFVIFFFNSALVGCVMLRMDGREARLSDGLAIARSKIGVIFAYAVVAGTVGMALRMAEERLGFVGKLVAGLTGVALSLATALVVPVLVARDVGPIEALKESAQLLKSTWGENLGGRLRIGVFFFLAYIAIALFGVALTVAAGATRNIPLVFLCAVVTLVAILFTAMVNAALAGIYSAALYRYAVFGEVGAGFDQQLLNGAFLPKK